MTIESKVGISRPKSIFQIDVLTFSYVSSRKLLESKDNFEAQISKVGISPAWSPPSRDIPTLVFKIFDFIFSVLEQNDCLSVQVKSTIYGGDIPTFPCFHIYSLLLNF